MGRRVLNSIGRLEPETHEILRCGTGGRGRSGNEHGVPQKRPQKRGHRRKGDITAAEKGAAEKGASLIAQPPRPYLPSLPPLNVNQ